MTYILICKRVDELWLVPCEFGMTFEHAYGNIDLALLQAELCECRNRSFTFWIRTQCLIATRLRRFDILLPLEQGQTLVNQWKHIRRFPAGQIDTDTCVIIKGSNSL
jgi:hypothetical protein